MFLAGTAENGIIYKGNAACVVDTTSRVRSRQANQIMAVKKTVDRASSLTAIATNQITMNRIPVLTLTTFIYIIFVTNIMYHLRPRAFAFATYFKYFICKLHTAFNLARL